LEKKKKKWPSRDVLVLLGDVSGEQRGVVKKPQEKKKKTEKGERLPKTSRGPKPNGSDPQTRWKGKVSDGRKKDDNLLLANHYRMGKPVEGSGNEGGRGGGHEGPKLG